MAKKKTETDAPRVMASEDPLGGVCVTLPEAVRTNCDVLRWLHHWVVDALADRGSVVWMAEDVEKRLGHLSADIVGTSVSDLVRQAQAATSKPKESQAPKNGAKRKRK